MEKNNEQHYTPIWGPCGSCEFDDSKDDDLQSFIAMGQAMMDASSDHLQAEIETLKQEAGVSDSCAADIIYLRGRSRWTPELEARLIKEHNDGKVINIMAWPPHIFRKDDDQH